MKILEKYTGSKTYMYPNGELATVASVTEKFPAWQSFTHVVETDGNGEVMFAFENLSALRSFYEIDSTLSEDEAIAAIQEILNAPPEEPAPSAEERIAAAMEYQALSSLPDVQ